MESYVGVPEAVKELTAPFLKSILIALPKAESEGQPVEYRGLQLEVVSGENLGIGDWRIVPGICLRDCLLAEDKRSCDSGYRSNKHDGGVEGNECTEKGSTQS